MKVTAREYASVAQETIHRARLAARPSGESVTVELARLTGTDIADLTRLAGQLLSLDTTTLVALGAWTQTELIPFVEAVKRRCAIVVTSEGFPVALIGDGFDAPLDWLSWQHPSVKISLVAPHDFNHILATWEASLKAMPSSYESETSDAVLKSADTEELTFAQIAGDQSPTVKFVSSTLYDALKSAASDIHFESHTQGMIIKFRLDGVLVVAGRLDGVTAAEQVISRIKVMASLDIAERRIPQDGRLQVSIKSRPIDVRVSIMPSIHGEDAVLRILDRSALGTQEKILSMSALGFETDISAAIHRLARLPHGMLLVTGPTGSGKTTTLYAALSDTQILEEKTITIEDPVEYNLPGVLQIPVNEKKGLTFAKGLRSILRHDPDRILVGEIRDAETAQIAVQSALTGHVVFTTVHANGVLDVFGRFAQFGIDSYSFVSALNAILAQRLIRKLCLDCATPAPVPVNLAEETSGESPPNWRRSVGCAHCRHTGFRGRAAIGELLILDAALRSMIADRASLIDIQRAATATGMVPLRKRGYQLARAGLTTIEEVDRVTAA